MFKKIIAIFATQVWGDGTMCPKNWVMMALVGHLLPLKKLSAMVRNATYVL